MEEREQQTQQYFLLGVLYFMLQGLYLGLYSP